MSHVSSSARPSRRRPSAIATSLCLLALPACAGNELAQQWQLDRLRILGVQATPAEPQPGETVTFQSLVYLPPESSLGGIVWFACLPENASDFGCDIDSDLALQMDSLDPETMDPSELQALYEQLVEAGFIGFEPAWAPTWTPAADVLDGLDERDQLEGVSALINLTAFPSEGEDVEIAYKRVPVSLATTPNHNPDLTDIAVDGLDPVDGILSAQRGQTYELSPIIADESIETYSFVNNEGETEERTEEPYFTWFAEGGSFDQFYTLHPYSTVEWTAPDAAFDGVIVVVMRDRRGGMNWHRLQIVVD